MAKVPSKFEEVVTGRDRKLRRALQSRTITHAQIARRAYDLYAAGGRENGRDVEDWLLAERQLNAWPAAVRGGHYAPHH